MNLSRTVSKLAPIVAAGLLACDGKEVSDADVLAADSASISGECSVEPFRPFEPIITREQVADESLRLVMTIGELDGTSEEDLVSPLIGEPNFSAWESQFKAEEERQANLVLEAGGYCNLPVIDDAPESGFSVYDLHPNGLCSYYYHPEGASECFDNRLGNGLGEITEGRDQFLQDYYPEWVGKVEWQSTFGRTNCEEAPSFWAGSLDASPWFSHVDEDTLREAESQLDALADRWNKICAEAQGGLFDGELHQNPLAGAQILVDRGLILARLLHKEDLAKLQRDWRNLYTPDVAPDKPLSVLEDEQFFGSVVLSKVIGNSAMSRWTCLVGDISIADAGYSRDGSGIVYKCEAVPELEGKKLDGVRVPFSVFPAE
jgi:hypothetical protein